MKGFAQNYNILSCVGCNVLEFSSPEISVSFSRGDGFVNPVGGGVRRSNEPKNLAHFRPFLCTNPLQNFRKRVEEKVTGLESASQTQTEFTVRPLCITWSQRTLSSSCDVEIIQIDVFYDNGTFFPHLFSNCTRQQRHSCCCGQF